MKNKKFKKLNDFSQLASAISFNSVEATPQRGRFERNGEKIIWVPDDNGIWQVTHQPTVNTQLK